MLIAGILQMDPSIQFCERLAGLFPDRAAEIDGFEFTIIHKLVLDLELGDLEQELRRYDGTGLIDKSDKLGRTPLHWAVFRDDIGLVKVLLEYGADPTIVDKFRGGALYSTKSLLVLLLCVEHCPPSFFRSREGINGQFLLYHSLFQLRYVVSFAELRGLWNVILKLGAGAFDINSQNPNGDTLLIVALLLNRGSATQFLLYAGADIDGVNRYGMTAATVGLLNSSYEALNVLFTKQQRLFFTIKDEYKNTIIECLTGRASIRAERWISGMNMARVMTALCPVDPSKDGGGRAAWDMMEARINDWVSGRIYKLEREVTLGGFHLSLSRTARVSILPPPGDYSGPNRDRDPDREAVMDSDAEDEFYDASEG
ncbi:hypothetical protein TWF481_003117 [Arthrobotrys musiformis]|uniref:Ankyrin n=1 Tax=Arthrobotrys musiformis TaxID=47236 RepID=A0AAV9VRH9_9PEZI